GDPAGALILQVDALEQVRDRARLPPIRQDASEDHLDAVVVEALIREDVERHGSALISPELANPRHSLALLGVDVASELPQDRGVLVDDLGGGLLLLVLGARDEQDANRRKGR